MQIQLIKKDPVVRCEVCKEIIKVVRVHRHEISFLREDNTFEKYKVCLRCFNKYLLQLRQDKMPDFYKPEKISKQKTITKQCPTKNKTQKKKD